MSFAAHLAKKEIADRVRPGLMDRAGAHPDHPAHPSNRRVPYGPHHPGGISDGHLPPRPPDHHGSTESNFWHDAERAANEGRTTTTTKDGLPYKHTTLPARPNPRPGGGGFVDNRKDQKVDKSKDEGGHWDGNTWHDAVYMCETPAGRRLPECKNWKRPGGRPPTGQHGPANSGNASKKSTIGSTIQKKKGQKKAMMGVAVLGAATGIGLLVYLAYKHRATLAAGGAEAAKQLGPVVSRLLPAVVLGVASMIVGPEGAIAGVPIGLIFGPQILGGLGSLVGPE